MRSYLVGLLGALGACTHAQTAGKPAPRGFSAEPIVVPGGFEKGRQPDGNSVVFDAPDGLIVVDTGRHAAHVDAVIAEARRAGKPIAAIVNTHWHLDHTGGNAELLAAYPGAQVYA